MPDDNWWEHLGPAFRAAIRSAERAGRISYRELDAILPSVDVSSEQIEKLLAYLREKGIKMYEGDAPE